jgi:hypothetical protein
MGLASGSALAAATILALSLTDGIKMTRLLDVFDIFFHLSTLGKAQTDDSAHITPPTGAFQPVASQRFGALAKDRRNLALRASSLANDLPI